MLCASLRSFPQDAAGGQQRPAAAPGANGVAGRAGAGAAPAGGSGIHVVSDNDLFKSAAGKAKVPARLGMLKQQPLAKKVGGVGLYVVWRALRCRYPTLPVVAPLYLTAQLQTAVELLREENRVSLSRLRVSGCSLVGLWQVRR